MNIPKMSETSHHLYSDGIGSNLMDFFFRSNSGTKDIFPCGSVIHVAKMLAVVVANRQQISSQRLCEIAKIACFKRISIRNYEDTGVFLMVCGSKPSELHKYSK